MIIWLILLTLILLLYVILGNNFETFNLSSTSIPIVNPKTHLNYSYFKKNINDICDCMDGKDNCSSYSWFNTLTGTPKQKTCKQLNIEWDKNKVANYCNKEKKKLSLVYNTKTPFRTNSDSPYLLSTDVNGKYTAQPTNDNPKLNQFNYFGFKDSNIYFYPNKPTPTNQDNSNNLITVYKGQLNIDNINTFNDLVYYLVNPFCQEEESKTNFEFDEFIQETNCKACPRYLKCEYPEVKIEGECETCPEGEENNEGRCVSICDPGEEYIKGECVDYCHNLTIKTKCNDEEKTINLMKLLGIKKKIKILDSLNICLPQKCNYQDICRKLTKL